MRFEMGSNDCEPAIEVVSVGDEQVVRFWGFAHDEAERWFNSEPVLESLDTWQTVMGDFEISVKVKKPMP